jgi:hypothetical protein
MRPDQLDPLLYNIQNGAAVAHLLAGHYDTAAAWVEKASRELPSYKPATDWQRATRSPDRLVKQEQAFTWPKCLQSIPACASQLSRALCHSAYRLTPAGYLDDLRKAGLPEWYVSASLYHLRIAQYAVINRFLDSVVVYPALSDKASLICKSDRTSRSEGGLVRGMGESLLQALVRQRTRPKY